MRFHIITCRNSGTHDAVRQCNMHIHNLAHAPFVAATTSDSSRPLYDVWERWVPSAVPMRCNFPNFAAVFCICTCGSETISWSVLGSCPTSVRDLRVPAQTGTSVAEMLFPVRGLGSEWITLFAFYEGLHIFPLSMRCRFWPLFPVRDWWIL